MYQKLCTKLYTVILIAIYCVSTALANDAELLVKYTTVVSQNFYEQYTAIGQCKDEQSREYFAQVAGTVDAISTSQGRLVKKGDVLITIDLAVANATKSKAEAAFTYAKKVHESNVSLASSKVISREGLTKSQSELEKAQYELLVAEAAYNHMAIHAPFNGYMGVVEVQVGDHVNVGDYLFTIASRDKKNCFVALPENLHNRIDTATKVWVIDSHGSQVDGKVEVVSSHLNENGVITAKISFSAMTKIFHGSYNEIHFMFDYHDGLALPEKTILKNNQGNFVYKVAKNNTAQQIYVTTGTRLGDLIEIKSDQISQYDQIIIEGLTKVHDGVKIKAIPVTANANEKVAE